MKYMKFANNFGFTLLETMLALGILSATLLAVAVKMKHGAQILKETSQGLAVDAMELNLGPFMQDVRVLNESVKRPISSGLSNCIVKRQSCDNQKSFELPLYREGDTQAITGPTAYYDENGLPCASCKGITVRTLVYPRCFVPTNCFSGPDFIIVEAQISIAGKSTAVRTFFREVILNKDKKFPNLNVECPYGEVLRGIGLGGQGLCIPTSDIKLTGPTGDELTRSIEISPMDCQSLDVQATDQSFVNEIGKDGKITCAKKFW